MITYQELNEKWMRTHPNQKEPIFYLNGIEKEINDNNLNYVFIGFNINCVSEFKGAKTKLILKCPNPKHKQFENCTYNNFTKLNDGRRCPECSKEMVASLHRNDTETFKINSSHVHNNFYDYSKTTYGKNAHEKVIVTCPIHGDFKIRPAKHYNGAQGCSKCAEEKQLLDSNDVIERINIIHDNHFEFTNFEYKGIHKKSKIICSRTGREYKTTPNTLLQGYGCRFCHKRSEHTFESFIDMANVKHNNKYYYHLAELQYDGLKKYVDVLCSEHGIFTVLPTNHIHGKATGCPKCAEYGYNSSKAGHFYIQKLSNNKNEIVAYKYGITKRLSDRIIEQQNTSMYKHEYIYHEYFEDGEIPPKLERIVEENIICSYLSKDELGNGYTETYEPKYHEKVLNLIKTFFLDKN